MSPRMGNMSLPNPSPNSFSVVTGASQGIGQYLAINLAKRGYNVILVARRQNLLDELAQQLEKDYGVTAIAHACDLANPAARQELIKLLQSKEISILCNDAGTATFGTLAEMPEDKEHLQMQLNANAVHELILAVLPQMVQRREGGILNVGSAAGNMPIPYNATYAATKAFVNTFSESLRGEMVDYGINVTLLAPGPVRPMEKDAAEETFLDRMIPSFMWANSDEVAKMSLDALSENKRRLVPGFIGKVMNAIGYLPHPLTLPGNKATYKKLSEGNI